MQFLRPKDLRRTKKQGMQEIQGQAGPAWVPPASPRARGAYPPGHKRVSFLQCGGVQLKERGDVVAMRHSNKAVLDLLPSVSATYTALHTLR